ncbi:MAG TPA: PQQ-binding-like beta-propeller repeat protein, partial [Acetobacteraceae bacterium]|nr:PQQ-binding-like beta-propeller repeat protein [Acetobacteraceae bacterium]
MTFRAQLRSGTARLLPVALGVVAAFGLGLGPVLAQTTSSARPNTTTTPGATAAANASAASGESSTPSPQEFLNAAGDNANWILPAKSYTGNHYTNATQINPGNVSGLHLAWTFHVDDSGPMENSPIVYNGTMYVTSAHDHVYALDAATGKLKWEFKNSPHVISFAANRGIGLLDGNVYIGTLDGHLIALNAETGQKVWDKVTVDDTANAFYTMA